MKKTFERIAELDRLIHEPSRLAILTALSSCASADFVYLKRLTGMTQGNLSSHLSRLENVGFVKVKKRFIGKKPNTTVELTDMGHSAIKAHWENLDRLRREAKKWEKDNPYT